MNKIYIIIAGTMILGMLFMKKRMIADLVVKMRAKGMVPGADQVLRIF